MQDTLAVGLVLALVSMVGTLLALGVIAVCIVVLQRLLPEREPASNEGPK
jgi:hypothetical protein